MKLRLTILGTVLILGLSSCTSSHAKIESTLLPLVRMELSTETTGSEIPTRSMDTLTINRAIRLALDSNPRIKAAFLNIRAHEARATQESKWSNPELAVDIENFAGSGPLSGFQSSETTISVGQVIELGQKRQLRTQVANTMGHQAALEYEAMRLNLITDIRGSYARISAGQARLELITKLLELSERFNANVDTLVRAGRYSSAERARSEVEHQNLLMRRFQAESLLKQTKQELAATWGGSGQNVGRVAALSDEHVPLPHRETILDAINSSPAVMLANMDVEIREAEARYARSLWIPDPTVSAGLRRINETNDRALVAGLSIPIPILNRNKAGIEEAQHRRDQSEQLLSAEHMQGVTEASTLLESLETLNLMVETLDQTIIPAAEKAYQIINQNYRLGQYGLIDVIDSQRQLFDAQLQYLDTRLEYDNKIIQLEGLLGRSISNL